MNIGNIYQWVYKSKCPGLWGENPTLANWFWDYIKFVSIPWPGQWGANWDVKIAWTPSKVNNETPEFKYLSEVPWEKSLQSLHRRYTLLLHKLVYSDFQKRFNIWRII